MKIITCVYVTLLILLNFSACVSDDGDISYDSKTDIVDEVEWRTAFASSNFDNVTMKITAYDEEYGQDILEWKIADGKCDINNMKYKEETSQNKMAVADPRTDGEDITDIMNSDFDYYEVATLYPYFVHSESVGYYVLYTDKLSQSVDLDDHIREIQIKFSNSKLSYIKVMWDRNGRIHEYEFFDYGTTKAN